MKKQNNILKKLMKTIKILFNCLFIILAASCNYVDTASEKEKLELKEKQLDYLERLYRIRDVAETRVFIEELDSLILEENKKHDKD